MTRQSANNSSAKRDSEWVQYPRSGMMDSGASKYTSDGIGTINLVKCRQGFSGFIGQGAVADFKGSVPMWIKTIDGRIVKFTVSVCIV